MRFLRTLALAALIGATLFDARSARAQQLAAASPFVMHTLDTLSEPGSPDGKFSLFHKGAEPGRLYLRDAAAGSDRMLVDLGGVISHVTWSFDSRRIALTFKPAPRAATEIRLVTVATGENRRLVGSADVLAWTIRDEVLFSRQLPGVGYSLWLASSNGSAPRMVLTGYADGTITPDGSTVIVASRDRIVLHSLATEAERTVTSSFAEEAMPIVSPDGKLLAFASTRDGAWALYVAPLDRLPVQNPLRIATLDGRPDQRIAWWTPSGALAFRPTFGGSDLYRIDIDPQAGKASGPPQRLTHDVMEHDSPIISPNSEQIVNSLNRGATNGLGVVGARGGAPRMVFQLSAQAPTPVAWRSPEEVLVYDAEEEPHGFASVNVRTLAMQAVRTVEIARLNFAYLTGRQEVLYAAGPRNARADTLKALSLVDGTERLVATIDYLQSFLVSPDGRSVAYVRWPAGRQNPGEIRMMTSDGQADTLLRAESKAGEFSTVAAWSPDGRFLLYFDPDDLPRVMNVTTGESWSLIESDDPPDWSNYDDASWSPDGSFIVIPGDGTWHDPQLRVWEGVTYDAVTRLVRQRAGP